MKRKLAIFFSALALPLALACDSTAPTAPGDAGIEAISEAQVLAGVNIDGLTDEQKAALRAAFQEARQALERIRHALRAGEITREQAIADARQIHQRLMEAIASILTPEQLEQLRHHPQGPGDLGLTEEQIAQLRALHEAYTAFVRSLREQVQNGAISAEDARAQLRAKARELRVAMCGVLTAEQQSQVPFCAAAG